MKIRQCFREL